MRFPILASSKGASVFYVKIILSYLWTISLVPLVDYLCNWDNCEVFTESWNPWLEWDTVTSGLFLPGVMLAIVYVRQMPIFSGGFIFLASWHIITTTAAYLNPGFDSRLEINLSLVEFLRATITMAVPFVLAILFRLVWSGRRAA